VSPKKIYTIGHSTRSIDEFLALLRINKIELLCDIRSFPHSKKWPQFNKEALSDALTKNGIEYLWLGDKLGGYRKNVAGSEQHKAIRSESFKAYVAHLLSPIGQAGIAELSELALQKVTAYMCAEKLPFRCHRWFLSDFLVLKGFEVIHIVDEKSASGGQTHNLSPLIVIENDEPIYKKLQKPVEQELF